MNIGAATLVATVVIAAVVLVLVLSNARRRTSLAAFTAAARYDQEGRFEDACYHYAIAVMQGAGEPSEARVRALWRAHGPFSFSQLGDEMRHSYCPRFESCGEGFHQLAIQEIRRIVEREASTP